MGSSYTQFSPRLILSEDVEAFTADLRKELSPEQLPSLAKRAADLACSQRGSVAGACLAAHAILLALWHSAEGEPRTPEEWEADLRVIYMLANLIEDPSKSLLAGIGRAWQSRFNSEQ
jgi:hypothetical protein